MALPRAAVAYEEKSLLTADGTLHVVRTGAAVDLGVTDAGISPQQTLVEWSSRAQDGTVSVAILPGTVSYTDKHGLEIEYDEQTATLLALWTENVSAFSQIRVGVLRDGAWTNSLLLPSAGISRAHNPKMLVTHRGATYLDANGATVSKTSSILSVVWWEESQVAQARYAALFLDETNFDPTALAIYDLPAVLGTSGETSMAGIPSGAYLYPSLQADGLSGDVLGSFADLHDQKFKVVRVELPDGLGASPPIRPARTGSAVTSRSSASPSKAPSRARRRTPPTRATACGRSSAAATAPRSRGATPTAATCATPASTAPTRRRCAPSRSTAR